MAKTKRVRQYAITYPQCAVQKEHAGKLLKALPGVKHAVVAQEVHEDGHTHLHAYVHFEKAKSRKTDFFDIEGHHGNIQACRCVKSWIQYITKEDKNPWTFHFDVDACLKGKRATLTIARAAEMTYLELRDKIRPEILQRFMAGLQLDKMLTAKVQDLEKPCGLWIFGRPGIGKSYDVRRYCKAKGLGLYDKPHNKWWDGYSGEEVVVLDDLHPDDKNWITKFLKTWTDAYTFKAETKGGMMMIRPRWVIITSNFEMHCFTNHSEDLEALHRRITFFTAEKYDDTYTALQETIGRVAIPATPPPSEPEPPQDSELDKST